jgi:hypothetical protein
MGAVIFLLVVVCWAVALGRLAGGTGTWLPTGGRS